MSEKIQNIDVQVYPNWGGADWPVCYYDPQTLERKKMNTFADEALVEKWRQRVLDIAEDPTRLLIHVHENFGGVVKEHLHDYLGYMSANSAPGRLITIYDRGLKVDGTLRATINGMRLDIAEQVRVVSYGHHLGDCALKFGKRVVSELGIPETSFTELEELSEGNPLDDRLRLIGSVNPELGYYYSIKHFMSLPYGPLCKLLYSQLHYLLLYCTAEQVVEAARSSHSVEDFEERIGGDIKTFDHVKDFARLSDLAKAKRGSFV